MPFFKDNSGALHFLDDVAFAYILPGGCIQITNADAAELLAPDPEPLETVRHSCCPHGKNPNVLPV
ncbi:hypothetical protein LH447_00300 [Laribacter hongkongensis]|uniref:hypothetical protein n=1 Tax=Laribacter hongkongensis TaxID=168471 RepID=UPI001EFC9851|nr:hypothetical protein [Laribacter hongkongensis]MCG9051550.1 hypothetical protein [Laribacter hongkongensis]